MLELKRSEESWLQEWATRKTRKPLIIRGARQVGKSTLVRTFATRMALDLVELDFERDPQLIQEFETNDPSKIIRNLESLRNQPIKPGRTLLFLDEIQQAPEAIRSLRYFYEEIPELHVIAAGSLLEFALAKANFSMPVGRIEYMFLGPMQFEDFLDALGKSNLAQQLREMTLSEILDGEISPAVDQMLLEHLKQYVLVGGLPEAVATFADTQNFIQVDQVKRNILTTYRDDFGKYSSGPSKLRVQLVFDALPDIALGQFKYSQISRDNRAAELADAIELLNQAQLVHKIMLSKGNKTPLGAEVDRKRYKLALLDIGLLSTLVNVRIQDLDSKGLTVASKGLFAEQLVAQLLRFTERRYEKPQLFYWARERKGASAEVDFLTSIGRLVVPVEVKAGSAGSLKSLHQFLAEKQSQLAVRLHSNTASLTEAETKLPNGESVSYRLLSLPLYLTSQLPKLVDELI